MNFEKAKKFIEESERPLVIYHIDSDGICSAVLMLKYLKFFEKSASLIPSSPQKMMQRSFYKGLPESDLIIIVDIPADEFEDKINEYLEGKKIIIFDHHKITKDMNSENIVHFHPTFFGIEKYCPASKLIFDVLSKFDERIKEFDWIACIGIIGDSGAEEWREFIERTLIRCRYSKGREGPKYDTVLGEIERMIGSARSHSGERGAEYAIEVLLNSKDIEDFLKKSKKLKKWKEEVEMYIEDMEIEFHMRKEYFKELGLAFFEMEKPKYRIGSPLATILSKKYPHLTIVIIVKKDKIALVNMRRGDGKVDVAELVKKALKGIENSSGGGHRNAAGAQLPSEYVNEFKENIIQILSK